MSRRNDLPDPPKLGAELAAIRDDWRPTASLASPEDFDRDVAGPLALAFKAIREQFEARLARREQDYQDAREGHENAERMLMDSWTEEEREDLYDALRDVSRGVFTLGEVMQKWEIE